MLPNIPRTLLPRAFVPNSHLPAYLTSWGFTVGKRETTHKLVNMILIATEAGNENNHVKRKLDTDLSNIFGARRVSVTEMIYLVDQQLEEPPVDDDKEIGFEEAAARQLYFYAAAQPKPFTGEYQSDALDLSIKNHPGQGNVDRAGDQPPVVPCPELHHAQPEMSPRNLGRSESPFLSGSSYTTQHDEDDFEVDTDEDNLDNSSQGTMSEYPDTPIPSEVENEDNNNQEESCVYVNQMSNNIKVEEYPDFEEFQQHLKNLEKKPRRVLRVVLEKLDMRPQAVLPLKKMRRF
jgi:hypothetical protein